VAGSGRYLKELLAELRERPLVLNCPDGFVSLGVRDRRQVARCPPRAGLWGEAWHNRAWKLNLLFVVPQDRRGVEVKPSTAEHGARRRIRRAGGTYLCLKGPDVVLLVLSIRGGVSIRQLH